MPNKSTAQRAIMGQCASNEAREQDLIRVANLRSTSAEAVASPSTTDAR